LTVAGPLDLDELDAEEVAEDLPGIAVVDLG
jgi:hypothetical protein